MPPIEMTQAPDFDGIDGRPRVIKVMVSSRQKELVSERQRAKEGIRMAGFEALLFEDLDPRGGPPDEQALKLAHECHIFVLILGTEISDIVRREYQTARRHLRDEVLVFVKDVPRNPQTQEFLAELESRHTRRSFKRAEELMTLVQSAVLAVAERAILDAQAMSIELAFRPLIAEPIQIAVGSAKWLRFVLEKGDVVEGTLSAEATFDYCFVDEANYAILAASGARLATMASLAALDRGNAKKAFHVRAQVPATAVYYLWMETWALIGDRAIGVRCDIRRSAARPRQGSA